MLLRECAKASRFVDLFSGSGSVAHFVAENTDLPVLSVDLQHYSAALAACITERNEAASESPVVLSWTESVRTALAKDVTYDALAEPIGRLGKATVLRARKKADLVSGKFFITRHYGGHYFSPQQAYVLDLLYATLPTQRAQRTLGLAALLRTASACAAAPGHTAQPFQPTEKLLPYIKNAWSRDVLTECQKQVEMLAKRHARTMGRAVSADASEIVSELEAGDLVFCDPPYSAVQYSRFYHVLEGIAQGGWPEVSGAGRSPDREFRESSDFSMKSQATVAMTELLAKLRERSCRVIITFPDAEASNGLSGKDIVDIASSQWRVTEQYVDSVHSTLGGSANGGTRGGRRVLQEAVLLLEPDDTHVLRSVTSDSLTGERGRYQLPSDSEFKRELESVVF